MILNACAIHQPITDWRPLTTTRPNVQFCLARGYVSIQTHEQSLRSDFKLRFTDHPTSPKLLLIILNPLHQTVGKLDLHGNDGTWIDEKAKIQAMNHPIIGEWITKAWGNEVRFLLNLRLESRSLEPQWSESTQQRRLSLGDDREWLCKQKTPEESFCSMSSPKLQAEFNFTSVDCRHSL